MKFVRYYFEGQIYFGVVRNNKINKINGNIFSTYSFSDETVNIKKVKILSPVNPPNIFAIGLNYRQHARETGHSLPERPVVFLKATSSLTSTESNIILPEIAPGKVDYEAELAVIIGKEAKNISEEEVDDYILGYTCANDVSARDCQYELDVQWARAKSFDTFCPLGPWIETDLNTEDINIETYLNGNIMQKSNTSDMIFSVPEVISFLSKNFTLLPGTVVLTGTPEGVGVGRNPQVFLKTGDKIEIVIDDIGVLRNTVVG